MHTPHPQIPTFVLFSCLGSLEHKPKEGRFAGGGGSARGGEGEKVMVDCEHNG